MALSFGSGVNTIAVSNPIDSVAKGVGVLALSFGSVVRTIAVSNYRFCRNTSLLVRDKTAWTKTAVTSITVGRTEACNIVPPYGGRRHWWPNIPSGLAIIINSVVLCKLNSAKTLSPCEVFPFYTRPGLNYWSLDPDS